MPKAFSRCATSAPTRPTPTIPRVLPYSSVPWKRVRSQRPSRRAAWAWGMLRTWARISATVCSAAEITLDWGALTTITPSRVALATSTLSRPMPARPITFRSRPASSTSASTLVAERTTRASTPPTAASSSWRERCSRASTWWWARSSSTPASASGSAIRIFAMACWLRLVPEPGHHRAQRLAGPLDRVVGPGFAQPGEVGPALVVLLDPFAGERPRLDLAEDAAHLGPDRLVDHPRPAGVVAVLGGVRHRVAHPRQPALVHEVDDQLQLVQALEVGDLDQGLEAGLDERGRAAAEHRLLAEQVGLGLLLEGGDQRACAGAADRPCVGLGQVPGLAGGVLGDRDQHRGALAVLELAPYQVTGALGGDHGDVDGVQVALDGVRHQHHDQVGPGGRLRRGGHRQPGGLSGAAAPRPFGEPDPHL